MYQKFDLFIFLVTYMSDILVNMAFFFTFLENKNNTKPMRNACH